MTEADTALKAKDSDTLRLLLKVYENLLQQLLPHIRDEGVRNAVTKNIRGNEREQDELAGGCMNFASLNRFVVKSFKEFTSSLKNCEL